MLRVTTRLVQVSVVAHDKKGEPVAGLTEDDFLLLEEGRQQKVSFFSVESSERVLSAEVLPANTFSNYLERRGGIPTSLTVILLDGLNTRWEDQAYARNQIIKFLEQVRPEDRVAIYALGRQLRVLHDFSNSTASLLRVLARHKGQHAAELEASEPEEPDTGIAELDEFLREANQLISDFYTRRRAERTLGAFEAIANHLARLPGRKNLIWVSGSFPIAINLDNPNPRADRRTFSREMERAARALGGANMAIYPVDARGLVGLYQLDPAFSPASSVRSGPAREAAARRASQTHWSSLGTMQDLAELTGGRAFYNTNDIQGSIRRAISDTRVTYVLSYYPRHEKWDGRFRQIKVVVKRKGVEARHRRGYFAFPDEPLGKKEREAIVRAAAWSPLEATGLRMSVRLPEAGPGGPVNTRPLKFEILIPPGDVTLAPKEGEWAGTLDMAFVQATADGRNLGSRGQSIRIAMPAQDYARAQQHGLALSGELDLAEGAEQLRIVARDVASGALGSVTVPLVPKAAASPRRRGSS